MPRRVIAWGAGEDGQLGLGDRGDAASPRPVSALDAVDVVGLAAGSRNSLAISSDGRAGSSEASALWQVFVWGWNQRGTLGHPPDTAAAVESTPSQVQSLAEVCIVQAAIGGWHCLAVDDGGRAYAWGGNEYGQCGARFEKRQTGEMTCRDIPTPRPCAPHLHVKQVAAGGTHSVVLTQDGEVWTWGQPWPPGDTKQIWNPVKVAGLPRVRQVAVGAFHNLVLTESGQVWAWGNNEYGQLGTGDTQPRSQPLEVAELAQLNIMYAWGRGEHGRLGFGDKDKGSKMRPTLVELLSHEKLIQVGCGGTHSVVLTDAGCMFAFGRADNGRLGPKSLVATGQPVSVSYDLSEHNSVMHSTRQLGPQPDPLGAATTPSGDWRVALLACGGRHTLALAEWAPPRPARVHFSEHDCVRPSTQSRPPAEATAALVEDEPTVPAEEGGRLDAASPSFEEEIDRLSTMERTCRRTPGGLVVPRPGGSPGEIVGSPVTGLLQRPAFAEARTWSGDKWSEAG
eukprot:SM000113S24051  [mRNA]  locus=s113:160578:164364:- [translate_table: standard]